MLIENSFEVPAPIDRVWAYMLDVEKVVPCMPGAELTETIDESHWKGKVTVKLGPVSLSFAGKVEMQERDEVGHKVVLKGSGMEQGGRGAASATVTTSLEETPDGTRVAIVQDLIVQGQAAQFSRGMMQDVTSKLTKQFAECLQANMGAEEQVAAPVTPESQPVPASTPAQPSDVATPPPRATERPAPQVVAKPIGGFGLAVSAL